MVLKLVFVFGLMYIIAQISAAPFYHDHFFKHHEHHDSDSYDSDESYDDDEQLERKDSEELHNSHNRREKPKDHDERRTPSHKAHEEKEKAPEVDNNTPNQRPTYEVTEFIDDIPNTQTVRVPVSNFSINTPLNNATPIFSGNNNVFTNDNPNRPIVPNVNTSVNNNGDTFIQNSNKNPNLRKKYISVLHINVGYDQNKPHSYFTKKDYSLDALTDYLHGIKQGFFHGIHSIVSNNQKKLHDIVRDTENSVHEGKPHPQITIGSVPQTVWNGIRQRLSDAATKLHKGISLGQNIVVRH